MVPTSGWSLYNINFFSRHSARHLRSLGSPSSRRWLTPSSLFKGPPDVPSGVFLPSYSHKTSELLQHGDGGPKANIRCYVHCCVISVSCVLHRVRVFFIVDEERKFCMQIPPTDDYRPYHRPRFRSSIPFDISMMLPVRPPSLMLTTVSPG